MSASLIYFNIQLDSNICSYFPFTAVSAWVSEHREGGTSGCIIRSFTMIYILQTFTGIEKLNLYFGDRFQSVSF